jgi:hypothetical protein
MWNLNKSSAINAISVCKASGVLITVLLSSSCVKNFTSCHYQSQRTLFITSGHGLEHMIGHMQGSCKMSPTFLGNVCFHHFSSSSVRTNLKGCLEEVFKILLPTKIHPKIASKRYHSLKPQFRAHKN